MSALSEIKEEDQKDKLSTQGYRGTRDFYPAEQRVRNYMRSKIKGVLHSFGYEEYDGPFLEHIELYASKTSEEIVRNQLYSFQDRGERHLAIRPEMTPTLARMIASRAPELPRPIRWFSIPTCMRFERPQRGRLREFDQVNVDLFGGNPLDEDIEILLTGIEILLNFGASLTDFSVKINHRGIVNTYLQDMVNISPEKISSVLRLLDKKDKLNADEFRTECEKLNLDERAQTHLNNMLTLSLENIILTLGKKGHEALYLKELIKAVNDIVGKPFVQFSPEIMRGFDYYTGIIFEFFDNDPANRRSLFGGGRFDNLVQAFGADKLSGVGYGLGDVTLLNFLETHNLLPQLKKQTDVTVLRFSEDDRMTSLKLAQALRGQGLKVESPVTASKFGKQIQTAEKNGSLAIAFRGELELQKNLFSVKWLSLGLQESYSYDESGLKSFFLKLKESR